MKHEQGSGNHLLQRNDLLISLVAVVGLLFLIGQVRFLPLLFLLACSLMHMFMHRGHAKQDTYGGKRH